MRQIKDIDTEYMNFYSDLFYKNSFGFSFHIFSMTDTILELFPGEGLDDKHICFKNRMNSFFVFENNIGKRKKNCTGMIEALTNQKTGIVVQHLIDGWLHNFTDDSKNKQPFK